MLRNISHLEAIFYLYLLKRYDQRDRDWFRRDKIKQYETIIEFDGSMFYECSSICVHQPMFYQFYQINSLRIINMMHSCDSFEVKFICCSSSRPDLSVYFQGNPAYNLIF